MRVIPFLVSELRLPEAEQALLGVEWWPSYGHAVEHRDGVFLFDNGAGFGNGEIEATFSPRVRPVDDALEEAGISLGDVTGAANCHLHFDHCGQNARLRGMPIFVQRTEWAMVHEPDYTVPSWVDVPGLTYELLDGEAEVAPDIRLTRRPGTPRGTSRWSSTGPRVRSSSPVRRCSLAPNGKEPTRPSRRDDRAHPIPTRMRARSSACGRSTRSACTSPTTRRSGNAENRWRRR